MPHRRAMRWMLPLVPLLVAAPSGSDADDGGVYWHLDPGVKTCSMAIDPSLTQGQWKRFIRQAGEILSFKSLAPAEPIGRLRYAIGLDYSSTPVDQRDPAWINTFVHPDAQCPLGDRIELPALRARLGISERMDVGASWTTAPGANYGLVGAEIRYGLVRESGRVPAVSLSAAVATLTGVPDFNVDVYGLGVQASRRFGAFHPYMGYRQNLAIGREATAKVDLATERVPIAQGIVGAGYAIGMLGLAAEYDLSTVNTFTIQVGFQPARRAP